MYTITPSRLMRRLVRRAVSIHSALEFAWLNIFNVRGHEPMMAKRIDQLAHAISPDLICDGHRFLCSCLDCVRIRGIRIGTVVLQGYRTAMHRFR